MCLTFQPIEEGILLMNKSLKVKLTTKKLLELDGPIPQLICEIKPSEICDYPWINQPFTANINFTV